MFVRILSIGKVLREMVRYIGASPLSRRHQLETLRGLDDHLLRDIGICRTAAMRGRPAEYRAEAQALYDSDGVARGA
jgi:uncharacterized protein YjiS (DUF1127 family)